MLEINRNDMNIRELEYDYNNGDFKYNFEYKGTTLKGNKRLYSIDDLIEEDCDNLLEVEFINLIRKLKRGYGNLYYIINNLDLIDNDIKDTIRLIDLKQNK